MANGDELKVNVERIDAVAVVQPEGEIDLARSPAFRRSLAQVQNAKPATVVVNLANVPYMDSSGVATLVEAMQVARKTNSRLVLCGMQTRVRSIFEIARLDMVFTIVSTLDEAMQY